MSEQTATGDRLLLCAGQYGCDHGLGFCGLPCPEGCPCVDCATSARQRFGYPAAAADLRSSASRQFYIDTGHYLPKETP